MKQRQLNNIVLVINRVLAGLNALSAHELAKLGVTPQAARALVILLQHPSVRCSLLSRLLSLEATALSHLLRALNRAELIVRTRVENDNRAVEVRLTPKGTRVAQTCRVLALAGERQLLSGLDRKDLAALDRILGKLSDNVTPEERRIGDLVSRGRVEVRRVGSGGMASTARDARPPSTSRL